jgi:hypothetical protein
MHELVIIVMEVSVDIEFKPDTNPGSQVSQDLILLNPYHLI